MKNFFFILLLALGIYYYIDTIQVKKNLTFNNATYNLVRVSKTNHGYSNQYVKPQDSVSNWNEMIDVTTNSSTKDHKEFIKSTEKMVRPHSIRVSTDYRNDYSLIMYCLDSGKTRNVNSNQNGFIECSYVKAERRNNQIYSFQYMKKYSLANERTKVINNIHNDFNLNFNVAKEAKIPYVTKEMPQEGKFNFNLPF